jgi:hypothetical protein
MNGERDSGEPGLSGAVITLDGTTSITTTGNGLITGTFTFSVTETGIFELVETNPDSYRSTTPDRLNINVPLLNQSYYAEFGDTNDLNTSTIYGTVYDDLDSDGEYDGGEPGISNVIVSLSNGVTTTTNVRGSYYFPLTEAGYIDVIETDPPGFHSTTPNTVTVYVDVGQSYNVDFGDNDDTGVASFFGGVFDDSNANGVRENSELGLSGVQVNISSSPAPYITNHWGQYSFPIFVTGTYTVTETDPLDYLSTIALPGDPAVTKIDNNTLHAEITALAGASRITYLATCWQVM